MNVSILPTVNSASSQYHELPFVMTIDNIYNISVNFMSRSGLTLTFLGPYSDIALPLQVKEAIEAGRRLTIDSTVFAKSELGEHESRVLSELIALFKQIHIDDAATRLDPKTLLERLQSLKKDETQ